MNIFFGKPVYFNRLILVKNHIFFYKVNIFLIIFTNKYLKYFTERNLFKLLLAGHFDLEDDNILILKYTYNRLSKNKTFLLKLTEYLKIDTNCMRFL